MAEQWVMLIATPDSEGWINHDGASFKLSINGVGPFADKESATQYGMRSMGVRTWDDRWFTIKLRDPAT